ncbi:MAG: hypothetical protein Q8R08_00305 [bacterium]|nr:hypothetical protein [bacterium]
MPNKSYKDKDIRKLTRVGKASFAVTLPVEYVAKLKWKEKQKLKVALKGRSIVIRDWKK